MENKASSETSIWLQTARLKPLTEAERTNREGKHYIENKVISETSRWLQTARLKPPTEALIMAAQDQAINTN